MSKIEEPLIRKFDLEKDLAHVKRIWQEIGWVEEEEEIKQLDDFFACGDTLVATIRDEVECSVHITDGTMRLQNSDLSLCAVTAVTTSRIARGYQLAQKLTAAQLADAAEAGAAVAALGMFDQGFYDKLGFGTGGYDHKFSIDPATLKVSSSVPTPERLGQEDFEKMHTAMCHRQLSHGAVVLQPARLYRAELGFESKSFGLGYSPASSSLSLSKPVSDSKESAVSKNELTHFVWLNADSEHGPYEVRWLCYQTYDQLIELLGLLKSLSDQVYSLKIVEPANIQLQALLQRPFRHAQISRGSAHEFKHTSFAWYQFRMLDVIKCVSALSCRDAVEFTVDIEDPIEKYLGGFIWRGVGGRYRIVLGANSSATRLDDNTPNADLICSINCFSRLIWGVAKASSLKITDGLIASDDLLRQLDDAIHLPLPIPGWEF